MDASPSSTASSTSVMPSTYPTAGGITPVGARSTTSRRRVTLSARAGLVSMSIVPVERDPDESSELVRRAERLKAALATGRMGEWLWDRTRNVVTWDENVHALFGL